ncbi:DUF3466 family protein [Idiomarina sp. PL1-037]|uniref:DUF3466 family protein n=1 Tax=Idiomarina sp. PL1-037 TaxID=3095365 RepID=UPI002ACBEF07|nr:DUF3466 family protein [Idiomarina sp. PL1-037]WQC51788.1 DUF3466 family protein [Idiomarina sp. PL1-037]
MKSFTLKSLTIAIVSTVSFASAADTYNIETIDTLNNYRSSVPQSINASGQIVGVARFPENVEIDFSKVPERLLIQIGFDPEAGEELTIAQYQAIVENLGNYANNSLQTQRVGLNQAFIYSSGASSEVNAVSATENQLANSVDSFLYSINNANTAVGVTSAPFELIEHEYTNSDDETETEEYFVSEFLTRGMWYNNGESSVVEPEAQDYLGGESAIFDINESGLAAGYESVSLSPYATTRIQERCEDPEVASASQPLEVCVWGIWRGLQNADASNIATFSNSRYRYSRPRSGYNAGRSIYDIRARLWQLDANGDVIGESIKLPTLVERRSDDENDFSSYAYAINNNGIAVGQSWTYHPERNAIRMPAIFQNEEALPVTEDPIYLWGAATDINDSNVAVGHLTKRPAGKLRSYGFYYDVDEGELTILDSFFNGASTIVRSINDNGEMVGTAEVDPTLSQVRARAGFYYDMSDEAPQIINLNNTISCDSEYNIVDANDITENGEIIATALKTEPYTDEDGEEQTREILVNVKLDPIEGELNNCTDNEEPVERQGAAVGFGSLLGFGTLGLLITGIRRRTFLKTKKS